MNLWPRYYVQVSNGIEIGSIRPPHECLHGEFCTSCGSALYDKEGHGHHFCLSPAEGLCEDCRYRLHPPRPVSAWRKRFVWPITERFDALRWAVVRKIGKRIYQ